MSGGSPAPATGRNRYANLLRVVAIGGVGLSKLAIGGFLAGGSVPVLALALCALGLVAALFTGRAVLGAFRAGQRDGVDQIRGGRADRRPESPVQQLTAPRRLRARAVGCGG
jgi:hypothetical protein